MRTKLLALLLLMLVCENSSAQYSPMLTDNPSWVVQVYDFLWSGTYTISQSSDVVIGEQTYKRFIDPFLGNMEFLLREDVTAKKVYKLVDGNEILLFDFSLNLSDQITLSNGLEYAVSAVNTIDVNGGQRKQLILSTIMPSPFWDEVWVEGVGSKKHPLFAEHELFSDPVYILQCSSKNGAFIYNQGLANGGAPTDCLALGVTEYEGVSSNISFAPNPFRTELTINTTVRLQDATLNIYNTLGQMVKQMNHLNGNKILCNRENMNPGIYLIQLSQNGKLLASKKVSLMD